MNMTHHSNMAGECLITVITRDSSDRISAAACVEDYKY